MTDDLVELVDMTAEPGTTGWYVVDEPHRCSLPRCGEPAVVVYWSMVAGYAWSDHPKRKHWRGKWVCAKHWNGYGGTYSIRDGRIWREQYEWEKPGWKRDG